MRREYVWETGKISLLSLTKIAIALECTDEIKNMFR